MPSKVVFRHRDYFTFTITGSEEEKFCKYKNNWFQCSKYSDSTNSQKKFSSRKNKKLGDNYFIRLQNDMRTMKKQPIMTKLCDDNDDKTDLDRTK